MRAEHIRLTCKGGKEEATSHRGQFHSHSNVLLDDVPATGRYSPQKYESMGAVFGCEDLQSPPMRSDVGFGPRPVTRLSRKGYSNDHTTIAHVEYKMTAYKRIAKKKTLFHSYTGSRARVPAWNSNMNPHLPLLSET